MNSTRLFVLLSLAVVLLGAASLSCGQEKENDSNATSARPANDTAAKVDAESKAGDGETKEVDKQEEEAIDPVLPLVTLAIGIAIVLGLIIGLKVNAFIALIAAAMVVSLMAPGELPDKISRVASSFGTMAGNIGIVIALAAVIGKCMLDSGAADRIVRAFLRLFGEKRAPIALMGSGFVLAVPVFFDTVFYLLVPLARSLHKRTRKDYLLYILAIAAGGAITHTLVPPTPGPLVMATQLKIDVGVMIMVGSLVALPAAIAGLLFSSYINRVMPIPMRQVGSEPDPEPFDDSELPSLWLSALPVILPVLMISANTVVTTMAKNAVKPELAARGIVDPNDEQLTAAIKKPAEISDEKAKQIAEVSGYTNIIGNANLALLLSTVIAVWTLAKQRGLTKSQIASAVEISLMSGGVIILITAGGGAFGAMLKEARVGDAIKSMFSAEGAGLTMLLIGFSLAALLKVAQGSSTAAMIIGSAMLASFAEPELLGFHPVYLATSIGAGSLIGSWMNDSGFWIFAKMGGLTEMEALKSWTIMLGVLGLVSFGMTLALSQLLPLVNLSGG